MPLRPGLRPNAARASVGGIVAGAQRAAAMSLHGHGTCLKARQPAPNWARGAGCVLQVSGQDGER